MIHSLSILIPAYNVAETIASVIHKATVVGQSITTNLEIVIVDDGSTDSTPEVLKQLKKPIPYLHVITHAQNQGYGVSIKDLYYAATKEWLVTLPGDDQIDPEEVRKLVPYHTKADMIMGKREIRNDHIKRIIQSKTYNILLKQLFSIPTTDVNTIRLMKQEIMKEIDLTMTSPFVDAEQILKAHKKGYTIVEVPILHKPRVTPGATGGKFLKTILPTITDMIGFKLKHIT